jgi:hypothetical protein
MTFKVQLFVLLSTVGLITLSHAQKATYWVVETNIHVKNFTVVKFYDAHDTLLDEIKLDGVYIDVSKERHKRKLNDLLYRYNLGNLSSSKTFKPRKAL